ncbi:hypothetical protein MA5S0422_0791 [Mycobacteroides abscessus 5S-0422]|uniref:Uncharacterized protein n=1 Tax=Mycobacteroides abscessus subsp. bolletii 1513 TaxID=1299321 RepID=X8DPY8_9MYCO|nr:hypothetical protein MA5S0304_5381 [Mycobacteroides abscessus 5S-0304]EIU17512.1 hypothetical protein MA5S0421_0190 [Mycobacteroides abscessus 5S-0421]EIU19091.1 hypothetical protein MA5S0422_0791 [Mycobacteroides abscessus 5S-0422]EIU23905.1 hypothetical protein MA5S0817_4935 [Mycobacteroides abscessus 5S-0817]EIU32618.1 hypothetical protein MA5S0708_0699 [Mycobacteroides abscessus 5S-0708]EIU35829.1 hypothetical protein MA5S1212_0372 [Mycobacteroides abscessus 5S-1212]EIU43720.1 hypothet
MLIVKPSPLDTRPHDCPTIGQPVLDIMDHPTPARADL